MAEGFSRRRVMVAAPYLAVGGVYAVAPHLKAEARTDLSTRPALAVPTFHSIGLYWQALSGSPNRRASVRYRQAGSSIWKAAHSMWFDPRAHVGISERGSEYRGSIVGLQRGTAYEIELGVEPDGDRYLLSATTWSDDFPIGRTVHVPKMSNASLEIRQSGVPGGFILYSAGQGDRATNDVSGKAEYNVIVDASYVIIRGLDLRNAARHAIILRRGAHHVVIEDNDISGWGRIADDGFGVDGDSAISNDEAPYGEPRGAWREVRAIVIQNNKIHHPRSNSNHWKQFRKLYGSTHPAGPQAITLWETGGNHVIRYNEIYSDEGHYFNDGIGGGENFSLGGGPGADSDIYCNRISHCWDDAIEAEGGNLNVRIWSNFLDQSYVMVGASPTVLGPLYVFRNLCYRGRYSPHHNFNTGIFMKAQSKKVGNKFWGGGRVYVYHNTLLRTSSREGTYAGVSGFGSSLLNYVSRNNIYDNNKPPVENALDSSTNDFDYDLYTSTQDMGTQERHGIEAQPRYISDKTFELQPGSPGHDDGVVIPNFSDGYFGSAPDRGAQEAGSPPLHFGRIHEW
jgi:hypothetical protein